MSLAVRFNTVVRASVPFCGNEAAPNTFTLNSQIADRSTSIRNWLQHGRVGDMQSLEKLRGELKGSLYLPSIGEYASAKRGKGTTSVGDRCPAIVIRAEGVDDIARSIEFARVHDIDFSIRSGGHDMLGASTTSSGVLIDLCRMDQVDLDPSSDVIRVGGGARAGALSAAGKPLGLAPVLGMSRMSESGARPWAAAWVG